MLRQTNFLTLFVALLVLPCLAFSATHKVAVGPVVAKADRTVIVPLEIGNEDGLMAADIPLQFSEGVTLKEVDFTNTRVEHFDLKVANINNESNVVIIGLLTQMTPVAKADLTEGTGVVANLVFEIDDPSVTEVTLDPITIEDPNHTLTFIYHEMGDEGPVGQRREDPVWEGTAFSLVSDAEVPGSFALSQNYPNPFNPSTNISFDLPAASFVSLDIFNVLGQKVNTVANGEFEAGTHTVVWDGTSESGASISSGVYFYRISAGEYVQTKKMMMLK